MFSIWKWGRFVLCHIRVVNSASTMHICITMHSSYQYKAFHYKDITDSRQSYHYNGKSHSGEDGLYIETDTVSLRDMTLFHECNFSRKYLRLRWILNMAYRYGSICVIAVVADVLAPHDDAIKWKYFPGYWPLLREFTGHRWIPLTKASGAELKCFLWSAPE